MNEREKERVSISPTSVPATIKHSYHDLIRIIMDLHRNWSDLDNFMMVFDSSDVSYDRKKECLDRALGACKDHSHDLNEEVCELLSKYCSGRCDR